MKALANPNNDALPYFPTERVDVSDPAATAQRYISKVELPVSAARLFEIFEDPESWTKWVLGIKKVVWTSPQPYGIGTTRTVIFTGGMEVYEDFTEWQAPHKLRFTFTGITQGIWSAFGEDYVVEERGPDKCHLTWTVGYTPMGAFKTFHFLVRPLMGTAFRFYMSRLRKYCVKQG